MKIKVLLFARDPGGANTIIPLYTPLTQLGHEVVVYGKDSAIIKFKQANIPCSVLNEEVKFFLKEIRPDFVITGTSADDFTEKEIWSECKNLKIKNMAIIDQWINYGIRFSPYSLSQIDLYKKNKNHPHLPTLIVVMDQLAKEEAITDGLPKELLAICGQPHFETILNFKPSLTRKDLNLKDDDFIITFASEPISQMYTKNTNLIGYTEKTILENLTEALGDFQGKFKLIIKLHPKENVSDFENTPFLLDTKTQSQEIIYHSDLIIGMSSMFLIEACLMGKPIMSVQIGLKSKDSFILSKQNVTKTILNMNDLKNSLHDAIISKKNISNNFEYIQTPTNNIIELMNKLLNSHL